MPTTAIFTHQDGLFIDANLHQFIKEQLCTKATLKTTEIYQALATLVDEFGCTCRKNKHQPSDTLEVDTLLNAYQQKNHPHCHMNAQTTEAVLDEYCCQVPAIIVVALMDTISSTHCDEPNAHAIYHRAAQLTNRPCMHTVQIANASAA
ncbi:hypothetical protein [Pseudoalteromonas sp. TB64]|uniref:hypothetical protein n=1 Tax=Pseudoalteromonas sp. TB64 TaxID=1938600 RepID=UPI000404CA62|nr:hypothetical protein [Pseudoalteromonas sp. TB64]